MQLRKAGDAGRRGQYGVGPEERHHDIDGGRQSLRFGLPKPPTLINTTEPDVEITFHTDPDRACGFAGPDHEQRSELLATLARAFKPFGCWDGPPLRAEALTSGPHQA
jgi:hypothetical protein